MNATAPESPATGGSFRRNLKLRHLVAFGLAYLAPTVVFNYYGIATSATGGMMALAYLVTMTAMFFTAFSYAQMVKAYPIAGSAYTYVQRSVNRWLGFGTGWVLLLDYLLLPMICYLLFAVYMNEYVPDVPVWIWVIAAAAFGATINIVGARVSGRLNVAVVSLQILFCLFLVGLIIVFVVNRDGAGGLFVPQALLDVTRFDGGGVLWAASILAVSFLGFDAVSTLAEEAEQPRTNVPRAVLIVCLGAGVAFAVISYFLQLAWPTAYIDLADPDTAFSSSFSASGATPSAWCSSSRTSRRRSSRRWRRSPQCPACSTRWAVTASCRSPSSADSHAASAHRSPTSSSPRPSP